MALCGILVRRVQQLLCVRGRGLDPLVVDAGFLVPVEPGHVFILLQNVHGTTLR